MALLTFINFLEQVECLCWIHEWVPGIWIIKTFQMGSSVSRSRRGSCLSPCWTTGQHLLLWTLQVLSYCSFLMLSEHGLIVYFWFCTYSFLYFWNKLKWTNTIYFLWLILFLLFLYYTIFPKLLNFYQYSLFKVLCFWYIVNLQEWPEKSKQGSVGKYR